MKCTKRPNMKNIVFSIFVIYGPIILYINMAHRRLIQKTNVSIQKM